MPKKPPPAKNDQPDNWLRDVILGGQDGMVNVLGIILGVTAANGDVRLVITAGLAAGITEAISMGAVAYTSRLAEKDQYLKARNKEYLQVKEAPDEGREDLRRIYESKGFSGNFLEQIVHTLTLDKNVWVETMMAEELRLSEVTTQRLILSSVIVGLAAILGSILPLLPFFFVDEHVAVPISVILCAGLLFSVGMYQAKTLVGSWWKKGLQMVIIGMGAALGGYLVGKFLRVQ